MCKRSITTEEGMRLTGLPLLATPSKLIAPLVVLDESPDKSLMVCFKREYRTTPDGRQIVERSPWAPIAYSDDGQREILNHTDLGLSANASIRWVNLLKTFVPGRVKMLNEDTMVGRKSRAVTGEVMKELCKENWPFTEMAGVMVEIPHDAKYWLVCQPRSEAENLRYDAIERDGLGIWMTEKDLYFVIPAGYQNVLMSDTDELSREEFFAMNAESFRKSCQKVLDAEWRADVDRERAERERQVMLPVLRELAQEIIEERQRVIQSIPECYYGNEKPSELQLDQDNFILDGQLTPLSEQALDFFINATDELKQFVADIMSKVVAADTYRALLREVTSGNLTVKDDYGILEMTGTPTFFGGKIVEVHLMSTEAVITVRKKDRIVHQERFGYGEDRNVASFEAELIKLGLKDGDDYDDEPETNRRTESLGWKERFMSAVGMAAAL